MNKFYIPLKNSSYCFSYKKPAFGPAVRTAHFMRDGEKRRVLARAAAYKYDKESRVLYRRLGT